MFFSQLLVLILVMISRGLAMDFIDSHEVTGPAEVREPATRSPSDDLRTIQVQISALGETRNLQLVPKDGDVFSEDFQGFLADVDETGNTVLLPIPNTRTPEEDINSKLYTDSTGSASLYVDRLNGQILLEGILDAETRIENDISRQDRSLDEPVNHVVYKRITKDHGKCEAVVPNITETVNEEFSSETRALPALVQPEVLVVLDYKTSASHSFNLNSVKRYLGIFFNSVNRRYASFKSPRISHVITGVILTNSEAMQNFLVYTTRPTLNPVSTLGGFGRWIYSRRASIRAPFDIAIWLTALKPASPTVGIAYVAGVCHVRNNMNSNVGLVYEPPKSYYGVLIATHEIAHLYGSAHDGDKHINVPPGNPGALSCSPNSGYIMSPSLGGLKPFHFSSCTINLIRFALNLAFASCLRTTPKVNFVPMIGTLPGATKSLNAQCQDVYGRPYIHKANILHSVCYRLYCGLKTSTSLQSPGPALEGSICARNKICINGVCANK